MATTLKKHIEYSKSPELFMKECWLTFDSLNKLNFDFIKPFDYQLEFIKNIHNSKNNIIVKSRQMHVSSMISLYLAWYIIFNENKNVVLISCNLDSAIRILEHVKVILQNYSVDYEKDGEVLKTYFHWEDDFRTNNKRRLSLSNGSEIEVMGPRRDAGKGKYIDLLVFDEAAYIKNFDELWLSLLMCVVSNKNGKIILASSPKENSDFNKILLSQYENSNFDTNIIRLHWSLHPKYSEGIQYDENGNYTSSWYKKTCEIFNNDKKIIEEELDCVIKYKEQSNKIKTVSLRLDSELHKKLEHNLKGKSISDYIRALIEKDLDYYV